MTKPLTKPEFAMLERLFAAEVEGALRGWGGIVQTNNLAMRSLVARGYAEPASERVPSRPPCTIDGWTLTLAGHMAYCALCADVPAA